MRQKLHAASDVQLLMNRIMPWVESELRENGRFSALAAWLPAAEDASTASVLEDVQMQSSDGLEPTLERQEIGLCEDLRLRWQTGEVAAAALVAPVLFGRAGSGERSLAVRLHIETQTGYCADILMPYRIRAASRWRGNGKNRVHFSQPVAQESDSRFDAPAPRTACARD